MQIVDFVSLNEQGREYAIFEYAVPVSTNLKNSYLHILYQLSYFFVEKIIDVTDNKLIDIDCFDACSERLDYYLEDIVLPTIF